MRANTRRTLISLVVVLAIVLVGWILLRPSEPQETAGPTPSQSQRPLAGLVGGFDPVDGFDPVGGPDVTSPDDVHGTAVPETTEIVAGPPVRGTDFAALTRMFDEEQALEHLVYLASDDLGGRQPGTPGGQAASDYIADRFAEYGLQPAGPGTTYFQTFTVPYGRITEPPVLTVGSPSGRAPGRPYAYRTDYRALTGGYLGAGEGEGPVVWLNECLHDDYGGLDMVGKVALCRYTGDPEVYRQAIEHQVGGLLLLDREREDTTFRRGGYRETAWVPQTIPAYLISESVAQDLLAGTDYTLDDLSLRFAATPLSTTVRMSVSTEEQDQVEARNVLGLLPGSDPEHGDEVVVIGAHYDHLGREPDGAIVRGANDNASGVATMIEIARLWQAQGFRPARSVLFAAWDGEEQGLLGSRHYVEDPSYPLTRTIAMLNLDMVGAGEALRVDGEGAVAAQLQASAGAYGITTTLTFNGRSDHVPFYAAGVPAATLIYWPDPAYHTPDDVVETIEPQKLKTAGVLSAHTLAALAEGHVELERAVERIGASIATGDREPFLQGLDPTDADLRAAQAAWFDSLWSRELAEVAIEPGQMHLSDGEADVALQLTYRWADETRREPSVRYDARFVLSDGTWTFAGYELDERSGDVISVARFPDVPVETRELLSTTQQAYLTLAADLGLEPITGTRFIYYPDAAEMRAVARPAASRDTRWLAPSAGLVEIAWGQPITPAVVNLALNQMGLPPGEGTWLREGLVLRYEDGAEREYLPRLAATGVLTSLLDFPDLGDLPLREAQALRGKAWSATEYLLARYGTSGLHALCAAWGGPETSAASSSRAFQEALGLSPGQFESAWRASRLDPLHADAGRMQTTIAARVQAVREGDAAGFLATVNPSDPVLRTEERNWFADLASHPVLTYSIAGELSGWTAGGREALVTLSIKSVITGAQPSHVTYDARFVRNGDRWFYAGVAWNELASQHFLLKYQDHDDAWGQRALDLAEAAYTQVTADLDATPPAPLEIKVYDDGELFRHSVSLSLPDRVDGRTGPGEAIKLWPGEDGERSIQSAIAQQLAHQVLFAQGLEAAWLHEGIARFEAGRVLSLGSHWMAGKYAPIVQEAVRHHDEFSLHSLPAWEDVPDGQIELFDAQSWSLVSFVVEEYGLPGLRRLIAQAAGTGTRHAGDTAADLRTALGVDPESFADHWREHARVAGVPDGLVSLAQRFSADRALAHVAALSSPGFGGREAGAPGADRAAAYIAKEFAALGLEPLGDLLTGTVTGEGDYLQPAYLQQFPVSYTHLVRTPALTLLDDDGAVLHEFTYRQDFLESAGEGSAEGELVWVHTEDLEGLRFGGAVVLEQDVDDPVARAGQLQRHGAGGLIVATDQKPEHLQAARVRPIAGSEVAIPVFKITAAAFDTLLEQLGLRYRDLSFAPPALPLGMQVEQTLVRSPITTTLTANVLGLLPGSDPDLADEVLVVGAHYDHIGRSPDGLYFPGANRNASGVSVLLEMGRVWQSAGYRPARSVLFAAWSAEELDSAGVAHFLNHPAVPLTQTAAGLDLVGDLDLVGVIALDSVGNGRGYSLLFYGGQVHDLPLVYRIEAGTAELNRRALRRVGTGEGWQALFNTAGIPTARLIWDEAERDFYLPTDTADRIDPDRLAFSGEILTLATSWLAGQ